MPSPSQRSVETTVRRSALLVAMYGVAAVIALWIAHPLPDFDYGLHLRTGEWTVEHGSVPDAEVFSSNSVTPRWVAYSWAYEVLLCGLHAAFGFWAPVVLSVAMALVISHVLFAMVRQISGRTTLAVGIAIIGIVAIAPMLYGRSMLFTVVFAALEVHLLVRATVLGERRALWFVPLVFVLWANVHIHFLYGLFVYGCFFAQSWLDALRKRSDPAEAERAWSLATRVSAVGVVCLLATLANPYHVRIYDPIVRYLVQVPLIYRHLQELSPPSLTSIPSWMTLALALLVVLGAGRRLIERPFLLLLFAVAMMVALRSARDAWFVVVTGSGLLAVGLRGAPEGRLSASPFAVAVSTAGVIAIAGHAMGVTTEALLASLRQRFPVDAADFIESERLEGPMYNDYNWGGYLMWRLPQRKVSIDGRTYVHSTDYILRSLRNWRAEPGWDADPELAAAGFVVGSKHWPLTTALRSDPRFRLAYEDAVSAVFVRQPAQR